MRHGLDLMRQVAMLDRRPVGGSLVTISQSEFGLVFGIVCRVVFRRSHRTPRGVFNGYEHSGTHRLTPVVIGSPETTSLLAIHIDAKVMHVKNFLLKILQMS